MPRRSKDILLPGLFFAGNLALLGPYLLSEFSPRTWTFEYTSIALARMFRSQQFTWNPLWYGGSPFHYAHPPLFPAIVAVLTWVLPGLSAARADHIVGAVAYALAPVTLYFLARHLFGSRIWAALAALTYSVSPSPMYLFDDLARIARPLGWAPWPFIRLVEHGEGPQLAALALLPLALLAAWRALEDFRFFTYAVASFAAALIPLTHRGSTFGLVIGLAAVLVAQARLYGYRAAVHRTLAIVATAHALSTFWLTAGYFHSLAIMAYVRYMGQTVPVKEIGVNTFWVLVAAYVLVGLARWSRTPRGMAFLLTWIVLAGLPTAAFLVAGSVLPEHWRYGLELNMALMLAPAGLLSLLPLSRGQVWLAAAAMVAALGAGNLFLRTCFRYQASADPRDTLSSQVAGGLARQPPGRVFVAGELAGTLNAFADVPQVGGGSDYSVSNPLIAAAQREVSLGACSSAQRARRLAELWPRALGCRYLLAHASASREYHHHFTFIERFAALPQLWSNGRGDVIYRVPGAGDTAVVVNVQALRRLPPLRSTDDERALAAYVAWAEGRRPAQLQWVRQDRARVVEKLGPGEAILVKTNYDPGWYARGADFRLSSDPIGFLLLEPPRAGAHSFELRYRGAWDLWLGRGVAAVTALVLLLGGISPLRFAVGLAIVWLVSLGGWGVREVPRLIGPRAFLAQQAFQRIQPPLISPQGIVDAETFGPPPLRAGAPVAILGRNFGGPQDRLRILVNGREARLLHRSSEQATIELPALAAATRVEIAAEVNGCRGNAFLVDVEPSRGGP